MCNQFRVDDWRDDARLVVMDDIDIKYFPWKAIFGAQREFNASGKYRATKRLRGGKPCVYCVNDEQDPRTAVSRTEYNWLMVNMIFIEVKEPLY